MPKIDKRQQKRWCFTLNNYNDDELQAITTKLQQLQPVYAVVGRERGTHGTPHLQGFIHFKTRLSLRQAKDIVGVRAHLEPARGTDEQNRTYCSKESDVPVEIGSPAGQPKGERTSVDFAQSALLFANRRAEGHELHEILETSPDCALAFLRHTKALQLLSADAQRLNSLQRARRSFIGCSLRKYQARIDQMVRTDPDPRKIHWYYDEYGNTGKTWFTRFLICFRGAIRFSNAKTADIAYAIRGSPRIVIFDYSRSQEEQINYAVLEDIKNGLIFSPKYESESKMFAIPHVLVFANWRPNEAKMSQDRWDIVHIDAEDEEIDHSYTPPDIHIINDTENKEN